jgi:hypothetical protein
MNSNNRPLTWKYMPLYEKLTFFYNSMKSINNHQTNPYLHKLLSLQIVKEKCPDLNLPVIQKVFIKVSDVVESDICTNHIIKLSHGSGNVLVLNDLMKLHDIHEKLIEWKQSPLSLFYIEESICDYYTKDIGNAYTFQVKCIHGKPFAIDIKYKHLFKSYDLLWKELPLFIDIKRQLTTTVKKPPFLTKIIDYAKKLAKGFEFMRVDFFIDNACNVYFNEFDFIPNGGHMYYTPELEKKFGKLWI